MGFRISKKKKLKGDRFVTLGTQKINNTEYSIINDTVTSVCYLQLNVGERIYGLGVSMTPMYKSNGDLYLVDLG